MDVPISSIRSGYSPRLSGEDMTHVARLAAVEADLPSILVDRRTMKVIDGAHRLRAASQLGRKTIAVRFFDGSPEDAFLHAVQANVRHGLPLSQDDRQAAAERIIQSHPALSDRAVARLAGLSAKTVAKIRRRWTGCPPVSARIGADGKVRPLSSVEGRRRAADFLAENPDASLRQIAQYAGISTGTVRDVRKRLASGEKPVPAGRSVAETQDQQANSASIPRIRSVMRKAPAFVFDKLLRDPSLRYNQQGQRLLRWMQHNPVEPQERSQAIEAVPPHCRAMAAQLAHEIAGSWLDLADRLERDAPVCEDPR